jgi:hypothetical protein
MAIVPTEREGKTDRNDWDVGTSKHQFLHFITIKMVLVIFYYKIILN